MDTSPDGSSAAAQSAPPQVKISQPKRGLFSRLFGHLLSPKTTQRPVPEDTGPRGTVQTQNFGMLNLRRVQVEDVAIPKADMVAVPVDIKKEDLVKVFRDSGLTRLPVYNGTLDTPIGLIHLKDFALTHGFDGGGRFSMRKLVRPLLFAPPSMPIGVLLQKMQSERMHMALVIDEYGGVDGLVTLEDLIEQVIGEIEDEHDIAEGTYWTADGPGAWIAQAKTPLDELEAEIGMTLSDVDVDEEIDTLGGLVFLLTGRVPARGEVVPHPSGAEFTIVDADPRRIKRVRVRLPEAVEAAE
ncbi:hemolysin family protein [Aliiroseovarius sp. PTFE2010]|uniref:hemolysin family protein n=1 Tax=Aliiroseovarius sp. PTFE2010 TaxID=3417190 RepID=UPI003CF521C7